MEAAPDPLSWAEFTKVDMRIGTIVAAEPFAEARNPSYKLRIDFGELGERKSSAQLTDLYAPADLIGRQVVAVVNFPPKQIATMMSECLVLGSLGTDKAVTLLQPERRVANGLRIG
ncbi:putative chaperone CsaA [Neolewinella maritima]|uniref:Chaperone CsaA n=1 Tax=Neolewinella maritima TaxID=1383882 RepID=A0ABM9B1L9_9BACT|nr:tRNA-binding protein [Neolewinella maritima]CAH1001240.1 putative chaperone CsaA [Neolewinella maritima]